MVLVSTGYLQFIPRPPLFFFFCSSVCLQHNTEKCVILNTNTKKEWGRPGNEANYRQNLWVRPLQINSLSLILLSFPIFSCIIFQHLNIYITHLVHAQNNFWKSSRKRKTCIGRSPSEEPKLVWY